MPGRLTDKVAIVSGAASGIGAATADVFAEEGAAVVVADIDEVTGKQQAERLATNGGRAAFVRLDVTSYRSWEQCMAFAASTFGKLNILVNNAGISYSKTVADTTVAEWDKTIATNQTGVFFGIQTAIEEMRRTGEPCAIANASSIDGLVGESRFFAYCAAKGAVTMMTKAAALYCAEQRLPIRVNSVHPGYVMTPMARYDAEQNGQTIEEYAADFISRHPVGHLGEPRDIAHAYAYLCSDEARFVSGTQLAVDGCYTAQ